MDNLFAEFSGISTEEWLNKIKKELKGASPEKLNWETEGLTIKPFYRREDQEKLIPQAIYRSNNNWSIEEDLIVREPAEANKQALDALQNGVESLNVILEDEWNEGDLKTLFKDIQVPWIELKLSGKAIENSPTKYLKKLNPIICPEAKDKPSISGCLNFDFHHLATAYPSSAYSIVSDFRDFGLPAFRSLMIDSSGQDSMVDQLAQTLAYTSQAIKETDLGDINFIQNNLHFRFSIGTSFFMEIAKLRAFSLLYPQLIKAFADNRNEEIQLQLPYIHAYTDTKVFNEDAHSNMIKSTTMAMSAVIGGASSLTIAPSDQKGAAFNRRIARNVQHLLKQESYLHRVSDPAAGSYYIEQITDQLARKAWAKFQDIDASTGPILVL